MTRSSAPSDALHRRPVTTPLLASLVPRRTKTAGEAADPGGPAERALPPSTDTWTRGKAPRLKINLYKRRAGKDQRGRLLSLRAWTWSVRHGSAEGLHRPGQTARAQGRDLFQIWGTASHPCQGQDSGWSRDQHTGPRGRGCSG